MDLTTKMTIREVLSGMFIGLMIGGVITIAGGHVAAVFFTAAGISLINLFVRISVAQDSR